MNKVILISLFGILTACGGGGGSSGGSSADPGLVSPPVSNTAQLTFVNGSNYACYLDEQAMKSVLYCWGSNSYMNLSAVPSAVVTVNRASGITNLTVMNESLCYQTTGNTPYNQAGFGSATYCLGRPNTVNASNFGGQNIVYTTFTGSWSTFNFTQDTGMTLGVNAIVGADMASNAYFALNSTFDGTTGVGQSTETCTVSGTQYVCPSVTLNLN